jgi:hypothetical protein
MLYIHHFRDSCNQCRPAAYPKRQLPSYYPHITLTVLESLPSSKPEQTNAPGRGYGVESTFRYRRGAAQGKREWGSYCYS